MTKLLPPYEAPPSSWNRDQAPFDWRRGLSGVAFGVVVGLGAALLDASAWWWLAAPAGLIVGFRGSRGDFPAQWTK